MKIEKIKITKLSKELDLIYKVNELVDAHNASLSESTEENTTVSDIWDKPQQINI